MKNALTMFILIFLTGAAAESKELKLFKDKICLPVGSKELSKIGSEDMLITYTTKKEFKFGVATIPAGCEVGFQTPQEQSSYDSDEFMESIRTISSISCRNTTTGFMLADRLVRTAYFDMQGCLEPPLFLKGDIKLCGQVYKGGEELPFKNHKIVCPKPNK